MSRSDSDSGISRRKFLTATAVGLATSVAGCESGGASPDAVTPPGTFVANTADVPVGTVIFGFIGQFHLLRDDQGLYALTATCTHQPCTLYDAGGKFGCFCHGSEFDYDGSVIIGPASLPLAHYLVIVTENGDIYVDPTSEVAATVRLSV